MSWGDGSRTGSTYGALLGIHGELIDHIKLDRLQDNSPEARNADLDSLKKFLTAYGPDTVVIGGFTSNTKTKLLADVKKLVQEGNEDKAWRKTKYGQIDVILIDDDVPRLYMDSKRASKEFDDASFPSLLKYCISLGRKVQDPTMEYAGLVNTHDDIKLLRLHPLQSLVPDDKFRYIVEKAFMNVVNSCGVDINLAVIQPHHSHTLQFVSGLGPRKAQAIRAKIGQGTGRLESRQELILQRICPAKIFMNCASFIRIRRKHFIRRRHGDGMLDVLDDTRIHPEDYALARKMTASALDIDEYAEDSSHIRDIMDGTEDIERLNLLMLDDYANELLASHGPKRIALDEIKDELMRPYKERRGRFDPPGIDEVFTLLTNETNETLDRDLVVGCQVVRVMERYVRVILSSSGLEGIIHIKNLSEQQLDACSDKVHNDQLLECRVLSVDKEKFVVDLSAKTRDVEEARQRTDKIVSRRDKYFDFDAERLEIAKTQEEQRKLAGKQRKVVQHPFFKQMNYRQAEKYLSERPNGEIVIRPSNEGSDKMGVTWKVDSGVYQHISMIFDLFTCSLTL